MTNQQVNATTMAGVMMLTKRLLTNAYVKRNGKLFLASAIGASITIYPINKFGQIIGEGKLLPTNEMSLEVIHSDDLKIVGS